MMGRMLALGLVALSLAGCSQVAALAPVGGDDVSEVRFATIDVLLDKGIEVLEAPTCALEGDTISCTGTTMDGKDISSTSGTELTSPLSVSVDDSEIFSGTLGDVLDEAARG